jgi:hypothetical protein
MLSKFLPKTIARALLWGKMGEGGELKFFDDIYSFPEKQHNVSPPTLLHTMASIDVSL